MSEQEQKYYLSENRVSTSPIEDGIEITLAQYKEAVSALSSGQPVTVKNDEMLIFSKEKITIYDAFGNSEQIASNADIPFGYSATKPEQSEAVILAGIKAEAARRINTSGHDWMALRSVTTGEAVPQNIIDYAVAVRAASNDLEQTLPHDYSDDKYWPDML